MKSDQRIFQLICGFVDKAGGIDRMEEAQAKLASFRSPEDFTTFVANLSESPAGAQALVGAARLGMTLASMIYRQSTGQ